MFCGLKGDLNLLALWKDIAVKGSGWQDLDVVKELSFIQHKIEGDSRFPTNNCIFRIFALMAPQDIAVMLLGQDPYPEFVDAEVDMQQVKVPRACGFAFSSPLGKVPYSLKIMFKELMKDGGLKKSGDLSYLIPQKVFLLNTSLTVRLNEATGKGEPGSHSSWHCFTAKVVQYIKQKNPKVVWMAIGDDAKYKMETSSITDYEYAGHPAAARFGNRGSNSFLGSRIFIRVNDRLKERDVKPIDWEPMDEEDVCDATYFLP